MENFKLSTSRDFRINSAVTNEVENGVSSDDDCESLESGDEDHGNNDPETGDKGNDNENNAEVSSDTYQLPLLGIWVQDDFVYI